MCIYRFCENKYVDDFINGHLSFGNASNYDDINLTDAQKDDELKRTFNPDIEMINLEINGVRINGINNIQFSRKVNIEYYLMSFTTIYNKDFYKMFDANSCIEVIDINELNKRIENALNALNDIGWGGWFGNVKYFNPKIINPYTNIKDILFSKSDSFAYQKEIRIAIYYPTPKGSIGDKRKSLNVGDLSDIVKLIE